VYLVAFLYKFLLMRFIIVVLLVVNGHFVFSQNTVTDVFKSINSPYDDINPVVSPDGKMLFFTIANHPQNIGGKKDPGDIWLSVNTGGTWLAPVHGGALLNDNGYNAVAGLSGDGTQLFILNHFSNAGIARTQGISVSKNNGNGWEKPENISIPYFQNKSALLSGYITSDMGIFIFSAETYGTKGVEDIYVSLNEDGRWSEPKNLGSRINTQFQEMSPSLSADGKTLFFSSNGRMGSGSFDVYSATRQDNTWSNWSEPVNLSTPINSEGRELFYREYASLGFSIYASTKNSDGYSDIKMYVPQQPYPKPDTVRSKPQNIEAPNSTVVTVEFQKSEVENRLIKIYGKVNNAKTGESVDARLVFAGSNFSNTVSATGNHGYTLQIPSTDKYTVKIEANGFISAIEKLDIQDYVMKDLEMNFKLQPVEIGATVNLKDVLFERGTASLLPESNNELDLVVSFLKANAAIKIELTGHTDNRGVHNDNVKLSLERANTVKQYLIENGIDAKRLTSKGYGGLKPIASNDTEETRRLNRRVEFIIKKF
jgi:outer membrane protein OmpA-like peptidoglycan-associated protein